jgi:hypothetical protein
MRLPAICQFAVKGNFSALSHHVLIESLLRARRRTPSDAQHSGVFLVQKAGKHFGFPA